jgi:hypothetical protein
MAAHESIYFGMTLGEIAVAVGTLALAGVTWRLASLTKRDVQDTHRLAVIARDAHEARYEPWLVIVGDVRADCADGIVDVAHIEIANVGAGAAVGIYLTLAARNPVAVLSDQPELSDRSAQFATHHLLMAGERRILSIAAADLRATYAEQIIPIGTYQDRTYAKTVAFPPKVWLRARLSEESMQKVGDLRNELEALRWQMEVWLA